jgi:hypothetical protein
LAIVINGASAERVNRALGDPAGDVAHRSLRAVEVLVPMVSEFLDDVPPQTPELF